MRNPADTPNWSAGRTSVANEVGHDDGTAVSKPTTSSMPASSGSAMVKPLEVIRPRSAWPRMPICSRYCCSACTGCILPNHVSLSV